MPKIWGNTLPHRTALLSLSLALALALAMGGCRTVPGPDVTHAVRAHWVAGCEPRSDQSARIDLEALGDFDPTPDTFETLKGSDRDAPLLSPPDTRAVVIDATDGFGTWTGLGTRDGSGDFDVALWPLGAACAMRNPPGELYPGSGPGQAVGVAEDGRTLLVAGGEGDGVTASALTVDLGTGIATAVSATSGPRTHRAGGTVTPFGANLLVAGGYDPETLGALGSAETFDVGANQFEPNRIQLERPRAHHAAVAMVSGETLLVGGVGSDGKPIRTLEALSPDTREYRIADLTELDVARVDPVALRLSDGTVLVAGGTDGASPPNPVETLEWLSADGSRTVRRTLALSDATEPTTVGQAFAAMPGGGVLVAGGCDVRAPADADESVACESACGPSAGCPSQKVQWIASNGDITTLPRALGVPAPHPVLVAGSEGRPWLVCDAHELPSAASPGTSAVLRFDPFAARFTEPADGVPAPSTGATHFVTADAGLFGWLERDMDPGRSRFSGFRHGTRSAFASNLSPLISADTTGVSLDRPPAGSFDGTTGHVTLSDAGATLVVTDTTYLDVHLTMIIVSGAPPIVDVGDRAYGASDCPWPSTRVSGPYTAQLDRVGGVVTLSLDGAAHSCDGPAARVSLRLEAGAGKVVVGSLTVRRSAGS